MAVPPPIILAEAVAPSPMAMLCRTNARLEEAAELATSLRKWLGVDIVLLDGRSGELLIRQDTSTRCDWEYFGELSREVARRGEFAVLEDADPAFVIAIPLGVSAQSEYVAVAACTTRPPRVDENLRPAARLLGLHIDEARAWLTSQPPVSVEAIERLAGLIMEKSAADRRLRQMQGEVESISAQIGRTFEEISLIYRLTQNLKLSSRPQELCPMALGWLADVIRAESFGLLSLVDADEEIAGEEMTQKVWFEHGNSLVSREEFHLLLEHLHLSATPRATVINRNITQSAGWPLPAVHSLVVVPLTEGEHCFGWLAAFNRTESEEFGTQEASLLNSVATILGVHSGNTDLYRQQASLLAGVVRAMSSAIDAKDPYTRGHSDRVARVSVRLAQELGCDEDTCKTLYLSGLLHDIGKIGIDDQVLRKPGKLTEAEYEHIKTHVEIGYRILRDLRKMSPVLPVVLHHHESWDGRGYPYGMSGANIPFLARIVAVADAYDAMSSDRPYRQGMDDARLDTILRDGAGKQWDPDVIDAFFRCRDDIRHISQRPSDQFDFDTLQWV